MSVVLGVLCTLVWFYSTNDLTDNAYDQLNAKARSIARMTAHQVENGVNSKDALKSINQLVRAISADSEISYLVVERDSAEVIAAGNLPVAILHSYNVVSPGTPHPDSTLRVVEPVIVNGEIVARVYIGLSVEGLRTTVEKKREAISTILAAIIGCGIIVVFWLATLLTRPLRGIVEAAERIARGDLRAKANSPYHDETGRLSNAVNAVTLNIDALQKRLENIIAVLDRRDVQLQEEADKRRVVEKQVQLTDEIINKASTLILVANAIGEIQYASPSFERVLGYKSADLLQDGWWKASKSDTGDDLDRMRERHRIAKCARREQSISTLPYEGRIIDARGNLRWILWQDTAGLNQTIIIVGQDITEHKLAETQIREQAALLDVTSDAIIVRSLDHEVLYWNQGAEKLYGLRQKDAIGRRVQDLFELEDESGIGIAYTSVIENGVWNGELKQVRKDAKKLVVESRWTLMSDDAGKSKSILVVNTDITERKLLETQFRRAQRLENIGTLAGGIAHDLNNVLTPILMSIQVLQKRHGDERTQQLLSTIDLSARRGADIVKQVLTFARGTEGERTLLQSKHLLKEIEKITKETFPRSIEIKFDVAQALWTITGDATQLHQVMLNLMVNARDAMPNGGTLSLHANNITLDEQSTRVHLNAKPGNYVVFSISDTGTGIPSEILDKIFDPFFTTKEVGKGTGLGLSTVMAIVKSYGGFLIVNSDMGKGTEFKAYIPATNTSSAVHKAEVDSAPPSGHGESILVVDDEVSIREIMKETLEAYGYRVQTAKDGIDALTAIEKDRYKYQLVLTDMMMPNMDGGSLIRALQRLAPEIKIIAVSGLTDTESLEKVKMARVEAFLPKPIQAENLLRIMDTALHSDEGQRTPLR